MDRPEYPVIWGALTEVMKAEYAIPEDQAFAQARKLIKILRKYKLDVVFSDWVFQPQTPRRRDPWMKAIEWLADTEESGREPWYPDGG